MEINKLLELDHDFVSSTSNVTISFMLQNINKGEFILNQLNEKEIPLEVTIYKILKGLPIHIVSAITFTDGKPIWNIVKGNDELKNIIKWINEDISINILGKTVSFKYFNDEDKKNLLENDRFVISTLIGSLNLKSDDLSSNDLIEIARLCF